jgi:heme exporter protein C
MVTQVLPAINQATDDKRRVVLKPARREGNSRMRTIAALQNRSSVLWTSLVGALLTAAILATFLAPTEQTMGDAQRVMYVHIPVAWLALLGFIALAASGLGYLLSRNLLWDQWSQATCEVGWLCSTLTLVTGSLWAHSAWGTWWTWDPRLVTSFILWAFYSGNLVLRSGLEDAHQRARLGAVLAIIGVADVPLVVMATRWFRGVHPVSPEMEPAMRYALLASVVGLTAVMTFLLVRRRNQLQLESRLAQLQMLADEM